MGLEEGNLESLSSRNEFTLTSGLPERCLQQMLSALDFLAYKGIVHRDIKPENILWSHSLEGPSYHFRLADFGVGKLARFAYSCQGTHWYMAPEILKLRDRSDSYSRIKERQSPKVDFGLSSSPSLTQETCAITVQGARIPKTIFCKRLGMHVRSTGCQSIVLWQSLILLIVPQRLTYLTNISMESELGIATTTLKWLKTMMTCSWILSSHGNYSTHKQPKNLDDPSDFTNPPELRRGNRHPIPGLGYLGPA